MLFEILVLGLFPGLVVLAATMDMFTMTIPNRLCLALIGAFFATAFVAGMPLETVGWHVAAAAGALLLTFFLFAGGVFGGGDAKLTTAIMLWLGPTLAFEFATLAAILGGVLTTLLLVMRAVPQYTTAITSEWATRLLSKKVGIPYGIALSTAAMYVFTKSDWFKAALAL